LDTVLIGFCGAAGSGKSTAAGWLSEYYGFKRSKMAAPLKNMLRSLLTDQGLNAQTVERMIEGDLKEEPSALLGGKSPRFAMQTLGTEWGRDIMSQNLWRNAWYGSIIREKRVIVDDIRFENEAVFFNDIGGFIIQIDRPDIEGISSTHASEAALPAHLIGARIINDGDLGKLREQMLMVALKHVVSCEL